jgi:hypothetical protein
MQLIRRHNRSTSVARNLFGEVRDLGARLEHLTSRYERLVRDLESATAATAPDMQARIRMANRELSFVAIQLQQFLVEKFEGADSAYPTKRSPEPLGMDDVAKVPFGVLRGAASA